MPYQSSKQLRLSSSALSSSSPTGWLGMSKYWVGFCKFYRLSMNWLILSGWPGMCQFCCPFLTFLQSNQTVRLVLPSTVAILPWTFLLPRLRLLSLAHHGQQSGEEQVAIFCHHCHSCHTCPSWATAWRRAGAYFKVVVIIATLALVGNNLERSKMLEIFSTITVSADSWNKILTIFLEGHLLIGGNPNQPLRNQTSTTGAKLSTAQF